MINVTLYVFNVFFCCCCGHYVQHIPFNIVGEGVFWMGMYLGSTFIVALFVELV